MGYEIILIAHFLYVLVMYSLAVKGFQLVNTVLKFFLKLKLQRHKKIWQ